MATTQPRRTKAPVELKVKVGAYFTYVGSLAVLAILGGINDSDLIANLPDFLSVPLAAALPAALSYWRAYMADHTPRPDLHSGNPTS